MGRLLGGLFVDLDHYFILIIIRWGSVIFWSLAVLGEWVGGGLFLVFGVGGVLGWGGFIFSI